MKKCFVTLNTKVEGLEDPATKSHIFKLWFFSFYLLQATNKCCKIRSLILKTFIIILFQSGRLNALKQLSGAFPHTIAGNCFCLLRWNYHCYKVNPCRGKGVS